MNMNDFQPIFHPRSVAIIGASGDPSKYGGRYYFAMKERSYEGKLYAVNPNVTDIDGDKVYARVQDIPDEIDFAIVAVAAPFVVQTIADCAEKRVRAARTSSLISPNCNAPTLQTSTHAGISPSRRRAIQ